MNERRSSEYLRPTMFDIKLLNFAFSLFLNVVDPFKIIRKYFLKPATTSLFNIFEEYKERLVEKLDGSQSLILRLLVIFTIGFLLFCIAVLLYILFYLMYMPSSTHVKSAHMQYNKICDDEKTCDITSMTSPYHSFPIAHLQLTRNQLMMVNQPYQIILRLEVPETPRNLDLGIFMVCVDMKDKENMLKSHACRSTMLRYRSPWLSTVKTILLMPFYIFGVREEKQELDIEIFSKYIDTTNSVTDIYVEIQSKVVEFYGVSMHITAHLTGLRYLIFHFPSISALVGVGVNFMVLVIITLLLWYHYDYEMEWVDEARRKYTGKMSPKIGSRKESSSISTTDENMSLLEYHDRLENDDFIFDSDDGELKNQISVEE